ncbi:Abi family protein [Wenyingzhuangia aestuarii]|uniref:Abi family protein n=1 Tax=Wenyingzhuangia aestuarii TaxID=1647582 RepID=UPI00143BE728|nr:Abi family protein [Wenyingzhuangia aestuarii]NJB82817.1 abortive infection bacteriophage resistance protein [Wenyingzhuangia aestuarii]
MFKKEALTVEQQVQKLQKRGLIIKQPKIAEKYLLNISYYRLGEYWHVMQKDKVNHIFKPNSVFEDVIALYNFDAKLRLLLFDVIEKIEISFRTKLIYYLSHEFNPYWFENSSCFKNTFQFEKTLEIIRKEINRSNDVTIKKHFEKYGAEKSPPSWKALEQVSLGVLSKLYGNLKPSIKSKKIIAREFGAVNHIYLPSWLQSITQIRNHCAHHSRLWNRNLPSKVKLLSNPPNAWIVDAKNVPKEHEFHKLYVHMCLMKYLLNTIIPNNDFTKRLCSLLQEYPNVDPNALGLKINWQNEPLWKY